MKKSTKKAVELGAGAAAVAALAAAAGIYLLSGKEGAKRKAKAKVWIAKAQREVAAEAKVAKSLGQAEYDRLVEQAVRKYGRLEDMSAADIARAARDIQSQWTQIKRHAVDMLKKNSGGTAGKSKKRSTKAAPRRKKSRA